MARATRGKTVLEIDGAGEEKLLLQIARKLTATIGSDFFHAIVRRLADALSADCVLVGEFVGGREERCRSVAAWLDGAPAEFDFPLAESATAAVLLGKTAMSRCDVQTRFPADSLLNQIGAQACLALPLNDTAGHPIGVLTALFRRPVASLQVPKRVMEIFAQRAAAELAREHEDEKLRQSEQRYRVFIARNADAMWRIEFSSPVPIDLPADAQLDRIYRTGYLAECNDALAHMLNRDAAEQLIGCGLEEIAPARGLAVREATMAAIRAGYQLTTVETSPNDRQGNRRHLLISQWGIVEDGKLERMWGSCRDITEVKHIQTALEASEQRMADLLESMRLLVVILDPEGKVIQCNRHFYLLTGWQADDVVGNEWLGKMVVEEDRDRLRSEFARSAATPDTPIHFESGLLGPNDRRWRIAWDSRILWGAGPVPTARALIGRDITEFRLLEEQFRQSQKLAAIGRLAGSVAHDFNNLLTVILGNASGLADRLDAADLAKLGLLEIRKAAEKGADLSRRLLTFGRRQQLRPQVVRLNTLVEEMEQMLETLLGTGVRLTLNLSPDAGFVRLDAGYFHQVLLNLVINARDAMPHGGLLTVATSNVDVDGPQPQVNGVPAGSYVQLTVADNGCGMPPSVREHLFEPFFTTKEPGKGTGLGLATVYGIIAQSGGHIMVDTEAGRGTAFRIYLPRVVEEPGQEESSEFHTLPTGMETLLLVEDREDVRRLVAKILRDLGYTVLEAPDAKTALEMNREHKGKIDLLVANMETPQLPVDELAELVKTFQPGINVLCLSTAADPNSPEPASDRGFGCLQKPFTPLDLAVKVREILDQR